MWPGCAPTAPRGGCCAPTTRRWCSASCTGCSSRRTSASIPATELASRLDDELYALNERTANRAQRSPSRPRRTWTTGPRRRSAGCASTTPRAPTSRTSTRRRRWRRRCSGCASLQEREFVGTESRLNTVFDLLRQIVFGTETDPEQRIAELRRQRQELDDEIARIEAGELDLLDASAVRDRYQQFAATARELLADFREVEENFRKLDRQLREKIAGLAGRQGRAAR